MTVYIPPQAAKKLASIGGDFLAFSPDQQLTLIRELRYARTRPVKIIEGRKLKAELAAQRLAEKIAAKAAKVAERAAVKEAKALAKEATKAAKLAGGKAPRRKRCSSCGKNWADPPSKLCSGCEAYREHEAA